MSLQLILKKFECKIDFAFDGQQAYEMVQDKLEKPCENCGNKCYIIYFLDINMPKMDGFELVRILKDDMKSGLL